MEFKKKTTILSGILVALGLVYVLGQVLSPERVGERRDTYAPLDRRSADSVARIFLVFPEGRPIELAEEGGSWQMLRDGGRYPVRRERVGDLLDALSGPGLFPVRASSELAAGRLGLAEDTATRISLADGNNRLLLDLLAAPDAAGRNLNFRHFGENEVRSGENRLAAFLRPSPEAWYDLRLFPEEDLVPAEVMRLTVSPPGPDGEVQVFTRTERSWDLSFVDGAVNSGRVDRYVGDILSGTADGFGEEAETAFADAAITIEFADGSRRTLEFGEADAENVRPARVSGRDLVFMLRGWQHERLFLDEETFR